MRNKKYFSPVVMSSKPILFHFIFYFSGKKKGERKLVFLFVSEKTIDASSKNINEVVVVIVSWKSLFFMHSFYHSYMVVVFSILNQNL